MQFDGRANTSLGVLLAWPVAAFAADQVRLSGCAGVAEQALRRDLAPAHRPASLGRIPGHRQLDKPALFDHVDGLATEADLRSSSGSRGLNTATVDRRGGGMLSRDLAYAGRTLRKSPVFAVTAALTIALGIGASTAIFSVTNAVLLRPLPYKNPDRLVLACRDNRRSNSRSFLFSNADFFDLRNGTNTVFEDMGGVFTFRAFVPREDGSTEQISKALVTTNFFRMMGAPIAFGRDFTEADGQPQPTRPEALIPPGSAAILGYEYWQRRYGGNTAVISHEMLSSGQRGPEIVGVLAPGFKLLFPSSAGTDAVPDFWVANNLGYDNAHRNLITLRAIGKLKNGVTLERPQEQVDLVAAELRKNIPWYDGLYIRLEPMHRYLVAEVRPAILALMGAVIFLLLIACANVANLLLVRASLRERELAVRAVLGGGWWRLMRQMLVEAVLLSGLGTLLGVGLAWLGMHELNHEGPAAQCIHERVLASKSRRDERSCSERISAHVEHDCGRSPKLFEHLFEWCTSTAIYRCFSMTRTTCAAFDCSTSQLIVQGTAKQARCRVDGNHLAYHQPVKEHADGGQVLLGIISRAGKPAPITRSTSAPSGSDGETPPSRR